MASRIGALASTGFVAGLFLFTALIVYQGAGEVAAALAAGGAGLLLVAAYHLIPLCADAAGWRCLLRRSERPGLATIVRARWIGESVNGLLPVMQIGGSIVRAQLLTRAGVPAESAAACVVVDVTLVVSTQLLFTLVGLALLPLAFGGERLWAQAFAGALLLSAGVGGFYALQRRGLFATLAGLAGRFAGESRWAALRLNAGDLDRAVAATYGDRRAVAAAGAWHLTSWLIGAGEVWLALFVLGHRVDLVSALLLESLGQAVRAAAFVIPAALGVQEGSYLLLGAIVGIPPDTALALSLAKRFRELVLGLPGLAVWQLSARRRGLER